MTLALKTNILFENRKRKRVRYFRTFTVSRALILTLCISEPPKRVLLQTVKTQMKCSIMWHIIRFYIVCKDKKSSDKRIQYIFLDYTLTPLDTYIQWTIPNLLYQTRRKNPLVYKGLMLLLAGTRTAAEMI